VQTAYLIYNPIAGTDKKKRSVKTLQTALEKQFVVHVFETKYAGHASLLAQKAACKNICLVIICGGDGSVNEVGQMLLNSNTKLAIVPFGSGNGLARHLNIPFNIEENIKCILKGNSFKMDVGLINNQVFVGIAGLGFDSYIGKKFSQYGKRGFWSYFKLVVKEYYQFGDKKFSVNLDGKTTESRALLLSFANSSQFGNNAFIAPQADVTDGILLLCTLKRFPPIYAPYIAYLLFTKQIQRSSYYQETPFTKITVKQAKKHAHLDGEPTKVGKKVKVRVLPLCLTVIHNL